MRLLFGQCVNPISLASLKRREIDRICKHNGYLSLKQFKKLKKIGISLKKFHSMSAIHQTKVFGIVSDLLLTHASFSTIKWWVARYLTFSSFHAAVCDFNFTSLSTLLGYVVVINPWMQMFFRRDLVRKVAFYREVCMLFIFLFLRWMIFVIVSIKMVLACLDGVIWWCHLFIIKFKSWRISTVGRWWQKVRIMIGTVTYFFVCFWFCFCFSFVFFLWLRLLLLFFGGFLGRSRMEVNSGVRVDMT